MTTIDKQRRLPDRLWVAVSSGVSALGEDTEGYLIEVAQRIFEVEPSLGFGDEARTTYEDDVSDAVVVWKFDRVQREPDSDAPDVQLTLRLDSEC